MPYATGPAAAANPATANSSFWLEFSFPSWVRFVIRASMRFYTLAPAAASISVTLNINT
jgi:hypothetical protein